MKKILVITLLIFISNTVLNAETIKPKKTPLKKLSKQLGNGELIKINSYQTSDYKGIMEGWYKESPIIVDALITYPEGEGPFPLLLIVHSSGGADEFTADWLEFMRDQQKPLLDMGIATMYLDNFLSGVFFGFIFSEAKDRFEKSINNEIIIIFFFIFLNRS